MSDKTNKSNKMSNRLIAMCSVAIGVIYSSGYVVTEIHAREVEPANKQAASTHSINSYVQADTANTQTIDQQPYTQTQAPVDRQSLTPQQSFSSSDVSTKSGTKYKDGTYNGEGSNHIGSVKVAVTIKDGKINAVEITNCTTSYPESYIEGLPQQVVDRQSSNVDVVSGATRSTEDFQTAVDEALQQAMNA